MVNASDTICALARVDGLALIATPTLAKMSSLAIITEIVLVPILALVNPNGSNLIASKPTVLESMNAPIQVNACLCSHVNNVRSLRAT